MLWSPCPVWSFRAFSTSTVILECSNMCRALPKVSRGLRHDTLIPFLPTKKRSPIQTYYHFSKCVHMLALDSIPFFFFVILERKILSISNPLQDFIIIQKKDCISYFRLWSSFVQSTVRGPQNSFKIPNHINSGAWKRPNNKLSHPGPTAWWEREGCNEMNKPSERGKFPKGEIKSLSTVHLNSTELTVIKSNPNSAISYKHIM